MSSSAFEDQIRHMEDVLAQAAGADPTPHLDNLRARLSGHIAELRALKTRQQEAIAERKRLTAEKELALHDGQQAAADLRLLLMSFFGPRDVRLRRFGITPLGGPKRRE